MVEFKTLYIQISGMGDKILVKDESGEENQYTANEFKVYLRTELGSGNQLLLTSDFGEDKEDDCAEEGDGHDEDYV